MHKVRIKAAKPLNTILIAGLIAGTADALAAVLFYTRAIDGENAVRVFQAIASGLFGKTAYSSSAFYPVAGLFLHYLIACIWAGIYYGISWRFLPRNHLLLKSVCTGILVWSLMNFVVLPASQIPAFHYTLRAAVKGILILTVAIGLPFGYIIDRNIRRRREAGVNG
jgi:hypothetical protein